MYTLPILKPSVVAEISQENKTTNNIQEIVYEGIVNTYVEGAQFPIHTAPTTDAVWATNIIKKFIVEFIKFPQLLFALVFTSKEKLLKSFNRIGMGVMAPYLYYKFFNSPEEINEQINLTPISRGIGKFTELFLINYGLTEETAHQTAELLAHIVEFDSFYRFKLLDLGNEINFLRLQHFPRHEVQRLLKLCYDREQIIPTYIRPKLLILSKLAWVLNIPKLNRAFKFATLNITKDHFKVDESDYYWMLQRTDYHYFGLSPEERMNIIKEKNWKLPVYV